MPDLDYADILGIIETRKNTMIQSMVENGYAIPLDEQDKFKRYAEKVRYLTDKQDLSCIPDIQKRSKVYHLDHKYSILQGYLDNIPTHIMADVSNLEILHYLENQSKGINCSISKHDLVDKFNLLKTT